MQPCSSCIQCNAVHSVACWGSLNEADTSYSTASTAVLLMAQSLHHPKYRFTQAPPHTTLHCTTMDHLWLVFKCLSPFIAWIYNWMTMGC